MQEFKKQIVWFSFMQFSVIIVSWNVRDLLRRALTSVLQEAKDAALEVFVVDNASRDGSAEMIRNDFPAVRLIANKENRGFAAACNQAIRESRGEYVLLLNPDTELRPGALQALARFLVSHPSAGVVGGKILNPDGTIQPSVRRFPTLASQILILLKLHRVLPRLPALRRYFVSEFDYTRAQEVDQVMGAFFCVPSHLWNAVGLFDERFFVWFEEVDFCKRVRDAGFSVFYTPDAVVTHHGGRSFGQLSPLKRQWLFGRSLARYMKKHHGSLAWLVIQMVRPVGLAIALLSVLASNLQRDERHT